MSRSFRRLAAFVLVAAFAAGSAGCAAEYDHTDITGVRGGALLGTLDRRGLRVSAGMVVTGHIVSYNDDDNIMTMNVRSTNPDILEVSNVISDHDFAFIGLRPGAAEVEVLAGNKVVLIISAMVVPQPTQP